MSVPEGELPGKRPNPDLVGMPLRAFLFTTDQIATMLSVSEQDVKKTYLFYQGRQPGARPRSKMLARNIAPEGEKPEWRVAERELLRWMKVKGFRIYDRGWPIS